MLRRFTTDRIRKARRKRLGVGIGIGVIGVISFIFLIVELVALPELAITEISFSGNRTVANGELFAAVAPQLEGSYGHLFSKRNTFIFPENDIEQAVLDASVKIERVRITRDGLTRLRIAVTEREPAGIWCPVARLTGPCYFVDDTALAFARAPRLSGSSFTIYEKDLPLIPLGKQLTGEEHFREVQRTEAFIMALGLAPRRIIWTPDALDVLTSVTKKGGETVIRIPLAGPYEKSLNNLSSVVDGFDFSSVEYVDVRFENKVFYKEETKVRGTISTTTVSDEQ